MKGQQHGLNEPYRKEHILEKYAGPVNDTGCEFKEAHNQEFQKNLSRKNWWMLLKLLTRMRQERQ